MSASWIQIVVVVALLVLLFGRGRISALMGDVAKGIKSFRAGLSDTPSQIAQGAAKGRVGGKTTRKAPSKRKAR